jgi:hypothetical protein
MRRRRVRSAFTLLFAASVGAGLANGCSAAGNGGTSFTMGSGGTSTTSGTTGTSSGTTTTTSTTGQGGMGGTFIVSSSSGGSGAGGDAGNDAAAPCGSKCGPMELCDSAHLGYDDNCNGSVDEGCPCTPGTAHWCFAGDPAYRGTPGCYDGTEYCSEVGTWGPCMGGVQAWGPNPCYQNNTQECHAITTAPYATVDLSTGLGNFGQNAVPGSGMFMVQCPNGVSQCPSVMPPSSFSPQQSGEYTVTYTKMVAGSGPASCTFPLEVGAPGLRVELSWEHTTADNGVDLDLHVHQPNDTGPWGISPPVEQDCTWSNCVVGDFTPPQDFSSPKWFMDDPPASPPTPVNWYNNPNQSENTCYNDPRGVGQEWQQLGLGCHNPRLDADNIECDYSITNPNDPDFCAPENINVDYPPTGQWIRIGVHYYNNHGLTYDVHPEVKIFCNSALAADLGPHGYYMPESPVTFEPSDGQGIGGNRFWIVADVGFSGDACQTTCVVKPVYSDASQQTPFFTIDNAATSTFAPAYPPGP